MSKFRQIVSIEWEGSDDLDERWLCPDNIAMCIEGYCMAKNVVVRRYPDKSLGNVQEIVIAYLKDNRYDGLFENEHSCSCSFSKRTCPCGDLNGDCRPGVLVDGKIVEKVSVVSPVRQTGSSKKSVIQTPDE